jgi:hypothetical protein
MARRVTPIQVLALGFAGVGAFYAAAQLSSDAAVDESQAAETTPRIMKPAPRPSAAASAAPDLAPASTRGIALAHTDRSSVIPGSTGDPFVTLSWLPPPPPPPPPVVAAPPAPPAPPVAPPLPFAFVGMVEQGTPTPQAFLSKGDTLLIVSAGDTIDGGAYRVESMDASQIVITHLPTHTPQTITVSSGGPK